ncbi:MAG TPA: hypothetical protein VFB39_11045 [Solirubrobacteraceae bacterium]|nr:hypothetical protein [Solirubrobacteraceae bacterium]
MTDPHPVQQDELLNRPGTYFNPQTEMLVVVDDSPEVDAEIFEMEELEGADWVQISDEVPLDEDRRDELLERFQGDYHSRTAAEVDDEAPEELEEEPEE